VRNNIATSCGNIVRSKNADIIGTFSKRFPMYPSPILTISIQHHSENMGSVKMVKMLFWNL